MKKLMTYNNTPLGVWLEHANAVIPKRSVGNMFNICLYLTAWRGTDFSNETPINACPFPDTNDLNVIHQT